MLKPSGLNGVSLVLLVRNVMFNTSEMDTSNSPSDPSILFTIQTNPRRRKFSGEL